MIVVVLVTVLVATNNINSTPIPMWSTLLDQPALTSTPEPARSYDAILATSNSLDQQEETSDASAFDSASRNAETKSKLLRGHTRRPPPPDD